MSDLYLDTSRSPEQRAQALLEELSLPEKMAQVRGIFPFGAYGENWEAISRMTKNGIGQVSTLQMREFHTKEACCAWQRRIQEIVMENSPHHIPAAFHMEGLCGAFIQGSVSLPSGIARGAGWDTALEEQLGRVVSRQEAACGITQTLSPVLDVAREPRMAATESPTGKTPPWWRLWAPPISRVCRRKRQPGGRPRELPSTSWPSTTPRAASMAPTA